MSYLLYNRIHKLLPEGPGAVDPRRYATIMAAASFYDQREDWRGQVYSTFIEGMWEYWHWSDAPDLGSGEPPDWCASFVSHCIRIGLGLPDWRTFGYPSRGYAPVLDPHPFKRWLVGVPQLVAWADEREAWVPPGRATIGDVMVQYTGGRPTHTGFYLGDVEGEDGRLFYSLEGNVQDRVLDKVRPYASNSREYRMFNPWVD